ncbi:MAG: type II toxin-antitoxin system VapC family toxin [Ktedonobacterales bacterium]
MVDASVAVKWHLQDEEHVDQALALLDQFAAGAVELVAPDQIRYEVPSAVAVATRRATPRLTMEQGREAIDEFLALGLTTLRDDDLIVRAYALVHQYAIAFYDALYLACAQHIGCPLIVADNRFYQRIRTLPHIIWIGDYATTP